MLFKKLLRDIAQNKAQFLCIFFMTFIGIGVYTGINASWYGMEVSSESYYSETKLADMWVQNEQLWTTNVKDIEELDFVSDVQQRFVVDANITKKQSVRLNYINHDRFSKLKLVEGTAFDETTEGIFLEERFARANEIKIGDEFTFEFEKVKDTQVVKGFVTNPEYVHYGKDKTQFAVDSKTFGYAYLSSTAFPLDVPIPYNSMAIQLKGIYKSEYKQMITNALDIDQAIVMKRSEFPSYASYLDEIDQVREMSVIFPVIFLLIAVLSTMSAMIRIVFKQRGQIGILKAIGFKNRKIILHYISYSLWITLLAAIAGYIIGPELLGVIILDAMKNLFTMPGLHPVPVAESTVVVIFSVILIVFITYFACRTELHEVIAESLRIKSPKVKKRTLIERSRLWSKLSFYTQWNLRDVFRNKARSLMGIFGIAGSCMLLICGLGLNDSIKNVSRYTYEEVNHYETRINLSREASILDASNISEEYDGAFVMEQELEFKHNSIKKTGILSVIEDQRFVNYMDENKDKVSIGNDEVVMSARIAELLGLKKGDTFQWRIYGTKQWKESRVDDIYRVSSMQGITMKKNTLKDYKYAYTPNAILTNTKKANIKTQDAIASLRNRTELKSELDESLNVLDGVIVVMVLGSSFLGFVVMYNLGVLTLNEKTRELASLKVLGFHNRKVTRIFKTQNIWLMIIGLLVGTPIGFMLLDAIMATMQEGMDIIIVLQTSSYVMIYLGIFALTLIINWIFSRKIKRIDMVESLKGVE